jgi:hypothetical protein
LFLSRNILVGVRVASLVLPLTVLLLTVLPLTLERAVRIPPVSVVT